MECSSTPGRLLRAHPAGIQPVQLHDRRSPIQPGEATTALSQHFLGKARPLCVLSWAIPIQHKSIVWQSCITAGHFGTSRAFIQLLPRDDVKQSSLSVMIMSLHYCTLCRSGTAQDSIVTGPLACQADMPVSSQCQRHCPVPLSTDCHCRKGPGPEPKAKTPRRWGSHPATMADGRWRMAGWSAEAVRQSWTPAPCPWTLSGQFSSSSSLSKLQVAEERGLLPHCTTLQIDMDPKCNSADLIAS